MKAALGKGRERPRGIKSQVKDGSEDAEVSWKKSEKKIKKLFEKYLTNGKLCGIVEKLSTKDGELGP